MKVVFIIWSLVVSAGLGWAKSNVSAKIEDGWIIATQGKDESVQSVRVRIWGKEEVRGEFLQLDYDLEEEFVVISKGVGTGPYYKLQIIDFHKHGILTWSYDSSGTPKFENGALKLGSLPKGYQGAATEPRYKIYKLSVNGLIQIPSNVQNYISQWELCNHWHGEEPYNKERRQEIMQGIKRECSGLGKRVNKIRKQYGKEKKILKYLLQYEDYDY